MRDSWWNLGEGSGQLGETLAIYQIGCPFCLVEGNFKTVFHAEKKKPNGSKTLNFDTLECGNCKGYVLVLWSAQEHPGSHCLHDYRVLPWPVRIEKHPKHWPETVGRYWVQAHRSLGDENWDAAAVMARSALQAALREKQATGRNLKEEIEDLAGKGLLPPVMEEWSHNVRELGNDSAHPQQDQVPTAPRDARDIVQFLDFLLDYLYTLPEQIKQYRARETRNGR